MKNLPLFLACQFLALWLASAVERICHKNNDPGKVYTLSKSCQDPSVKLVFTLEKGIILLDIDSTAKVSMP